MRIGKHRNVVRGISNIPFSTRTSGWLLNGCLFTGATTARQWSPINDQWFAYLPSCLSCRRTFFSFPDDDSDSLSDAREKSYDSYEATEVMSHSPVRSRHHEFHATDDREYPVVLKLGLACLGTCGAYLGYKVARAYSTMTPEEKENLTFTDIQARILGPEWLWNNVQDTEEGDGGVDQGAFMATSHKRGAKKEPRNQEGVDNRNDHPPLGLKQGSSTEHPSETREDEGAAPQSSESGETIEEKAEAESSDNAEDEGESATEAGGASIKRYYGDDETLTTENEKALNEIVDVLGKDKVELEHDLRSVRSKDDWSYHTGKIPLAICYPESTDDVSKLLKICYKYKMPVIPFGCGTSLEGHTTSTREGILCNMSRMDKIVIHEDDADALVQTGVQWMELNSYLEPTGFFFPMDPGPGASIGGMIGTCCSGTNAVKYGVMKDWVLATTVVLSNGDVIKLGSRARKDVAGYDLTRLFIGSEGTLGIVTDAVLKLVPKPEHSLVAICSFGGSDEQESRDHGTHDACAAVADVIRRGIPVSGAEYLDPLSIKIVNSEGGFDFPEKPTIMFKFSGTPTQLQEAEQEARAVCESHNGDKFQYRSSYEDAQGVEHLWSARKDLLFSAIGWSQGRESWITDVCVPIGQLPNIMQETIVDLEKSFLDAPVFGHVGDGNFHAAILFNPDSNEDREEAKRLNARMIRRAIAVEGTCSGEHGIGEGKKEFLKEQLTPETLALMKLLKRTLDPNNILNPDKILDLEEHEDAGKEKSH